MIRTAKQAAEESKKNTPLEFDPESLQLVFKRIDHLIAQKCEEGGRVCYINEYSLANIYLENCLVKTGKRDASFKTEWVMRELIGKGYRISQSDNCIRIEW